MMTPFRAAIAAAGRSLKIINGERFIVSPMTLAAGKYIADPSRAAAEITAILSERPQINDMIGERAASGMSKGIASQHAADTAAIEVASGDLPYRLSPKDRLMRLENYELYEVTGAPETDLTQIILRVAKLGKAVAAGAAASAGFGAAEAIATVAGSDQSLEIAAVSF